MGARPKGRRPRNERAPLEVHEEIAVRPLRAEEAREEERNDACRLGSGGPSASAWFVLPCHGRSDIARRGRSRRQADVAVRPSARTDALHEREPVVAEQRPQPRQELGLRHRARRIRVRDAVPLRPARPTSSSRGSPPAGTWTSKTTYVMTIRKGVKWSDGQALTAKDVTYSFDILKIATHPQHPLWTGHRADGVKASGNDRRLHVRRQAGLPAVRLLPLHGRGRPAARLQELLARRTSRRATSSDTSKIVGTGPYTYQSGVGAASETVVWTKKPNWWATKALGLRVAPKYIVDIKNGTNAAALSQPARREHRPLQQLRPEVGDQQAGSRPTSTRRRTTSGANTTWLFPNTTKKPLNDKQFRKALAFSINMNQILDKSYQGLVSKASPTGLLPIWNKWIDQKRRQAVRLLVQPDQGEGAPGRRRLQGRERRRLRREQGRVEDRPPDRLPERVVGLDDVDPGHRR